MQVRLGNGSATGVVSHAKTAEFERKSASNDELYGGHRHDELCGAGSDTFRLFRNLVHSVVEEYNLAATDYIASEVILVCISRQTIPI